jgi:hypothetical protein
MIGLEIEIKIESIHSRIDNRYKPMYPHNKKFLEFKEE